MQATPLRKSFHISIFSSALLPFSIYWHLETVQFLFLFPSLSSPSERFYFENASKISMGKPFKQMLECTLTSKSEAGKRGKSFVQMKAAGEAAKTYDEGSLRSQLSNTISLASSKDASKSHCPKFRPPPCGQWKFFSNNETSFFHERKFNNRNFFPYLHNLLTRMERLGSPIRPIRPRWVAEASTFWGVFSAHFVV